MEVNHLLDVAVSQSFTAYQLVQICSHPPCFNLRSPPLSVAVHFLHGCLQCNAVFGTAVSMFRCGTSKEKLYEPAMACCARLAPLSPLSCDCARGTDFGRVVGLRLWASKRR
jgi:hypothetical protein